MIDLMPGLTILTYGQEVKIKRIDYDNNIIFLEHSIIVPTKEYSRDFININEKFEIII